MAPDTFDAYVACAENLLDKAEGDLARAFELACFELVITRRAASAGLMVRDRHHEAPLPPEIVFPSAQDANR